MTIEKDLIKQIDENLEGLLPLYQNLPEDGVLRFDKLLPYICVYRFKEPDIHFSRLLKTQGSYLIVKNTVAISELLEVLSKAVSKKMNTFLILEMWPIRTDHGAQFEIICPAKKALGTVAALKNGFDQLQAIYPDVKTIITDSNRRHPPHLAPLLPIDKSKESGSLQIGLAIPTLYERREENEYYSLFYRKFFYRFSEIIKRAVFEFIRVQTSNPFKHYLMLGKTHVDQITLEADKTLAEISEKMSFLLRTTPVNSDEEWVKFKKNKYKEEPAFNYRLIALDPEQEKRRLYDIPIELIEDPTIAFILRDKRLEIEKQLTMLEERGTYNFRYVGQSLYGKIEAGVSAMALAILDKYPSGVKKAKMQRLNAFGFAEQAQLEIDYYQEKFPKLELSLEIRKDVAGIMVSETKLLINEQLSMDSSRSDALVQHEVATHILTYCNGHQQPLQQMFTGFAGYDQLQEGLAVLAEYLVGGITINRLRLLAGRVVAVESMLKDEGFITTYKLLRDTYKFPRKTAYHITMRVYRGGGLTKDAVYLAGLMHIMEYINKGGDIETLYTGKFNISHVALVEELIHRGVLRKPVLPRFLKRESVQLRLKKVAQGLSILELLE